VQLIEVQSVTTIFGFWMQFEFNENDAILQQHSVAAVSSVAPSVT
jgi:hypothetical protein